MKMLVGDEKLAVVQLGTVNSEIFVRVLFLRNFVRLKSSRNAEITLWFTNISNSWPSRELLAS